jgi:hypothetical protein
MAGPRSEEGQALPLALGGCFVIIAGAVALVAIAGAVTGKGRAQRAADLIAISAARSMRDDLPRLLSPPTLPNGLPNPAHMEKAAYLWRARAAGQMAANANEAGPARVRISFPDAPSFAPLRVRAEVRADLDAGGHGIRVVASAVAEAAAPALPSASMPQIASGGGYEGPLAYRQGEPLRGLFRERASRVRTGLNKPQSSSTCSLIHSSMLYSSTSTIGTCLGPSGGGSSGFLRP